MKKNILSSRAKLFIPIIVATTLFMEFVDITIINTSIPTIAANFSVEPLVLKISVASYYLSLAIFIPVSGWCTDKFGTKSMFIFSVAVFILASLFCGMSSSVMELTLFRFLQGIGGAFMVPVARIILLRSFPSAELIRIQSMTYTPALVGNAVGPFLGGVITTYLGWHWIFYINIPVGILVLYLGLRYIQQVVVAQVRRFDLLGFCIASSALILVTIFVEFGHYHLIPFDIVVCCGLLGFILFALLIWHCLTQENAVFDFKLFKITSLRIGFIVYFATSACYASIGFLLPIIFQNYMKFSIAKSGSLMLPIAFGTIIARGVASKFIHKFGFKYLLFASLTIFMLIIVLIAQININTPVFILVSYGFIFGASMLVANSCVGALNYMDLSQDRISMATSMDMAARQFAASLGIGISAFVFSLVLNYFNASILYPTIKPFQYTLYCMLVLVLIALYNTTKLSPVMGKDLE